MKRQALGWLLAACLSCAVPDAVWPQAVEVNTDDSTNGSTLRLQFATSTGGAVAATTLLNSRLGLGSAAYLNVNTSVATVSEGDIRYSSGSLLVRTASGEKTVVFTDGTAFVQASPGSAQSAFFDLTSTTTSNVRSTDTADGDVALLMENATAAGTSTATRYAAWTQVTGTGTSTVNAGLRGEASGGGSANYGMWAVAGGSTGSNRAVYGANSSTTASSSQYGLWGEATGAANGSSKYGVYGTATGAGTGTTLNYGVYGTASGATTNYGGYFTLPAGAVTAAHYGLYAENLNTNADTDAINKYGLYVTSTGTFTGLGGAATTNYGVYATATGADTNWAGYFNGDAYVAGNLALPTTSATAGIVTVNGTRFLHSYPGTGAAENTFLGSGAGNLTFTTANDNTGLGVGALAALTTGEENTAIGYGALAIVDIGAANTAVGRYSLNVTQSGGASTAVGYYALAGTTATGNTAVGSNAGGAITSGSNNTFLGYTAGNSSTAGITNATAIGYAAQVTASNTLILGGTGTDQVSVVIGGSAANYGRFIIQTSATGEYPMYFFQQLRGATTDATVTTISAPSVYTNTIDMVEARIVARRTGGTAGTAEDGASYVLRAVFSNVSDVCTQIGTTHVVYSAESQAGWDATLDTDGSASFRVRVTGAVNNNVTWHATIVRQFVVP